MINLANLAISGLTIFLAILLQGCMAAALPMIVAGGAIGVGGIYKSIQLSTGGSIEVAIDTDKISNEQKDKFNRINSIAVWPEKTNSAVIFSETLAESGRFKVISPLQVSTALRDLNLSDDLTQMNSQETKDAFSKVCLKTRTDSIISSKAIGGGSNSNIFSFDRANITKNFIVTIYGKNSNANILTFPVSIKILLGGSSPSSEEIARIANIEVAKAVIAISPSSQLSQKQGKLQAIDISNNNANLVAATNVSNKPLSIFEIQQKLVTLGYGVGKPDGMMGKKTINALMKFQEQNSLPITGKIDVKTTDILRSID